MKNLGGYEKIYPIELPEFEDQSTIKLFQMKETYDEILEHANNLFNN